MLQLKNIVKIYRVGDNLQTALKGVTVNFRDNEFVAILGQSGSGKTTMLNIIGGLDRYSDGDLIINGVSTKLYKDADWDIYRNNKIGFVFQSYNLIPHQSVLANVEMALTLSGVGKKERRERAVEVLKKVGLEDHIHKKPNQMSGGQMQRVAIARALINNPDILLADEPTGALDSATSIQIMDLLKEIANDKLVIMVTHNPELAEQYSTRTVKLFDGCITGDTDPFEECDVPAEPKKQRKVSMSFGTALSLSFNNLRTKKGRTILTAFAGSIGIIGIALILSLSTGMNQYIDNIQKDTMASYPITISSETFDTSGLLNMRADIIGEMEELLSGTDKVGVYANYTAIEAMETMTSSITENNLTDFKKYLDDPKSEIHQYLGENGVIYSYNTKFNVFSKDADGNLIDSDAEADEGSSSMFGGMSFGTSAMMTPDKMLEIMGGQSGVNFSEIMAGHDGILLSPIITESYEVLDGRWPEKYDEAVLVLDRKNSLSAETLYQLGLITEKQYDEAVETIQEGGEAGEISFSYDEIYEHGFYVVPACDRYIENEDGTFTFIEDPAMQEKELLENAVELKITGIIRPIAEADNATLGTAVAYTPLLTDYIIEHTTESAVIKAQLSNPETNVLNGMRFEPASDEDKIEDAKKYVSELGISEKASLYQLVMYYNASKAAEETPEEPGKSEIPADMTGNMGGMSISSMAMDESALAAMLDAYIAGEPDKELMLGLYDQYIGEASYEDNMEMFGNISYETPSSINIYTDDFESKDSIALCIENYNETKEEDDRITYTDYVALLTSSLTTIINAISYVLIAFVAISLVVSCIMIGIITHISVMERTKEIGILRALGASKSNISQVFNAETFIVGCLAGALGIAVSFLLLIPINAIVQDLTGISNLKAVLPPVAGGILIVISIIITIIGGLLPAKNAAKKDPVVALRTE